MDANKALLWIVGIVFAGSILLGNLPSAPVGPIDEPTKLESDLLSVFYPKGSDPEKARTGLLMFSGLNYCVANAIEAADESTGLPELKTGAQVSRFRKLQRMMVVGNASFVKDNPGLGAIIKSHFDAALGTDAGEITDASRGKWKEAHFQMGQASARACKRVK